MDITSPNSSGSPVFSGQVNKDGMASNLDLSNPWIITVIGGIIVAIFTERFLKYRKLQKEGHTISQTNNNNQSVTVNNILADKKDEGQDQIKEEPDILFLKSKARILFIENENFKKISNLRKLGWNVTQIKDVTDPDINEIRDSNIIFVDYKDIGKNLSTEQGIGVIKILKNRYKDSKWLILYSAHTFQLNVYDLGADSYLSKNSAIYEIERKIIQGARKVIKQE